MFTKSILSKQLPRITAILALNLTVLSIFSTFASISASAATNNETKIDLTDSEISQVQKISSLKNLDSVKKQIQDELKTNKSEKYKKFISTQIAVSQTTTNAVDNILPSKYSGSVKNILCWDRTSYVTYFSYYGTSLYRFNLTTNACADSFKVYSGFVRYTWGDIYAQGWSYYGLTSDRSSSYINTGSTEYIASRQGLFKLCINNNWGCLDESRPWLESHQARVGYSGYSYSS